MKQKILIVEDQFIEANNLEMILKREGHFICGIARSVADALKIIDIEKPDMVMLDIYLQGPLTGIDLAKNLREKGIAFIYLSANSNKSTLDAAKETKPYGFLVKPFRQKDVLVMLEIARYLHSNALDVTKSKQPNERNVQTAGSDNQNFPGIIGGSKVLTNVLQQLQMVAPTDTSVLILGETGTGKERIAETIHALSGRNKKPLVKVNCAALPPTLIESMLFGHEKGTFTGAHEKKIGKFEQANGGTIFLDEIGELPMEVQAKLLRVLQEKEIERLGSNQSIKIDVRIIAATNRNLEDEVAERRFRMDLYYRLNVFPLSLPALRNRKEDIVLLANYFADFYCRKIGKPLMDISEEVFKQLLNYSWPGNIRELEHTIERAILLEKTSTIREVYLPKETAKTEVRNRIKTMEENERDHIIEILKKCKGKIFGAGGAAELLGINPSTLNSRIKKLGIEKTVHISS